MKLSSAISLATILLSVLLISTGCSQPPYQLASVTGKVTIEGKPLTDGQVMFAPRATAGETKAGKPAFANLNQDGTFELSTYSTGDGAVVGEHVVTLYGPEKSTSLPKGVPAFHKIAIPGNSLRVLANTDNNFEIQLTAKDLQAVRLSGKSRRQ